MHKNKYDVHNNVGHHYVLIQLSKYMFSFKRTDRNLSSWNNTKNGASYLTTNSVEHYTDSQKICKDL